MADKISKGFVHTVLFWLKEKNNKSHHEKLHDGLLKLAEIHQIKKAFVGQPADTNREVIDSSYDFSITFIFDNAEDQAIYQTHPDHFKFIDNCAEYWQRVQVYDAT